MKKKKGGKREGAGRKPILNMQQKLQVYTLHLKRFWAHEIKSILQNQSPPVEISEETIYRVINEIRNRDRISEKESLIESIDSSLSRIRELNAQAAKIVNMDNLKSTWLGIIKLVGDEEERLAKLGGHLKLTFDVGKETTDVLYKLMTSGGKGEE
jgi:hypothetical protein